MKIAIDDLRCQGHGRCWESAPGLIDCDDVGRGAVRGAGTVPPELETEAKTALNACPERAVTLQD